MADRRPPPAAQLSAASTGPRPISCASATALCFWSSRNVAISGRAATASRLTALPLSTMDTTRWLMR